MRKRDLAYLLEPGKSGLRVKSLQQSLQKQGSGNMTVQIWIEKAIEDNVAAPYDLIRLVNQIDDVISPDPPEDDVVLEQSATKRKKVARKSGRTTKQAKNEIKQVQETEKLVGEEVKSTEIPKLVLKFRVPQVSQATRINHEDKEVDSDGVTVGGWSDEGDDRLVTDLSLPPMRGFSPLDPSPSSWSQKSMSPVGISHRYEARYSEISGDPSIVDPTLLDYSSPLLIDPMENSLEEAPMPRSRWENEIPTIKRSLRILTQMKRHRPDGEVYSHVSPPYNWNLLPQQSWRPWQSPVDNDMVNVNKTQRISDPIHYNRDYPPYSNLYGSAPDSPIQLDTSLYIPDQVLPPSTMGRLCPNQFTPPYSLSPPNHIDPIYLPGMDCDTHHPCLPPHTDEYITSEAAARPLCQQIKAEVSPNLSPTSANSAESGFV